MKGNKKVIETLNALLSDELTAVNQYILHAEICANWGYGKLHDTIRKRAIEEMKHAERLIERIIFLEGMPDVSSIGKIHVGKNIEEQFKADQQSELGAVAAYNKAILLCREMKDGGTEELFQSILADEEKHLDWLETQDEQIKQLELKNYLVEQSS